jgi:hypothetical protein
MRIAPPTYLSPKQCAVCAGMFPPNSGAQRYCSEECRDCGRRTKVEMWRAANRARINDGWRRRYHAKREALP